MFVEKTTNKKPNIICNLNHLLEGDTNFAGWKLEQDHFMGIRSPKSITVLIREIRVGCSDIIVNS